MPLRCADCNHKMLLTPDGATQTVACENCGGKRLERDQPSPVHGDMELRNMVDPGIGLDQGGNPNMEGIWANNGWQPFHRRDESFASVRTAMDFGGFDFESEPRVPLHHVIVDRYGGVYSGQHPETHEDIADRHRLTDSVNGVSKGAVYPEGDTEWYTHDSGHNPATMEQMLHGHFGIPITVDPNLQGQSEASRWGIGVQDQGARREMDVLNGPANTRSYGRPRGQEWAIRGGRVEANNMEVMDSHFPFHVADVPAETAVPATTEQAPAYTQEGVMPGSHPNAAKAGDGMNLGIHAGTTKWLGFLGAHVDGVPVRDNAMHIIQEYGPRGSRYEQPVTVSAHHPEHLAAAIDVIEHSATGGQPSPKMIEVGRAVQRGQLEPPPGIGEHSFRKRTHIYSSYGIPHLAFLPALLGLGAGALEAVGLGSAGAAAGTLMRGALMGTGSNLIQGLFGTEDAAGQNPSAPPPQARGLEQLSKTADLETPHTNPGFHDSPDGDPHQFDDQSSDPNPENPNLNGEAGGSQLGEDNVGGGFGPNSPSMQRFNLLFPAIMHYYHSDQSAAHDPMVRELHEMMDKENPGYLHNFDEAVGAQAVQHLVDGLRQPEHVHAAVKEAIGPVPGPNQGWNAVPDTRDVRDPNQVNWAQPQGMPGAAPCPYCGGQVGPDGHCTQCGAVTQPGVQPQGQGMLPPGSPQSVAPPGMQTTTPFVGKTAADTQGPVSKEQQAAVAQLLIDTNRHDEIPIMLQQPELYADELAQVTQNDQTTPPPIDPSQQPPPQPPMDPSQMGQMPMPGMSVPPGAAGGSPFMGKVATPHNGAPRCPNCGSATTGFVKNEVGDTSGECHSCGNIWDLGEDAAGSKTAADPGEFQNPAGVPAADQQTAYDPEQDQDSSHTWQDADGDPIQPGQEYELYTGQYPIPDRVRVDQVKPDEIVYSTIGEFDTSADSQGEPMEYSNRISRQEMEIQKYSFQKADDQQSDAGEQSLDQYADTSQAPQFTEPVQQPTIQPRGHVAAFQPTGDPKLDALLAQWDTLRPEQQQALMTAMQLKQNNNAMQGARERALNPVEPPMLPKWSPGQGLNQPAPFTSSMEKTAPMSEYDHLFGGSGGAAKALKAMKEKYGDEKGESVFYATVNKKKKKSAEEPTHTDDYCPKCASTHVASSMSSPTTEFHECYRCGHGWETKEEEYESEGKQSRTWLMGSDGPQDDFWAGYERVRQMGEADRGGGSRSLAAAAARDPRSQEISERLNANKMAREAGRKFTPNEQRQFIDEQGVARNADKLDLVGTHYESHRYLGERANGANVPDEDLFLGI